MPFIGTGVVLVDLNGRIAYASSYFCDLVGADDSKTIAGTSYFDFVFSEDLKLAKGKFEADKLADPKPFRVRLKRADGVPVWVNVVGTPMRMASGEVYGVSASITPSKENS